MASAQRVWARWALLLPGESSNRFFQMAFNAIDQVIVGLFGADAVAAVRLSNSIASIALLLYASAGVWMI